MNIETTLNIKHEILTKLNHAVTTNATLNDIISILLLNALKWKDNSIKMHRRVKYQKLGKDIKFHKTHVSLRNDIYEKCLDMKKLYKMSISFILAKAVTLYLEKLIQDLKNGESSKFTDNYFSNYIFISKNNQKIFSFTIFWQTPSPKTLLKYLN